MSNDTRQLLHNAAPDPTHTPDLDELWRRGRRQRRVGQALAATAAVALAVVAVAVLPGLVAGPRTPGLEVVGQPSNAGNLRMRVEPEVVAPGDVVDLYFPQEDQRGLAFSLERGGRDGWELEFYLASAPSSPGNGEWAMDWWRPDEERAVDRVGIGGQGPDRVLIPLEARLGRHRICAVDAEEQLCAELDVLRVREAEEEAEEEAERLRDELLEEARAGVPSQSQADAVRDGVLAEVAALPFDVRVERRDLGGVSRIETDEGVWIVSEMPFGAFDYSEGCALGATDDPDAVYRRDVVCTVEYGEVLLLNHDETEILRAFPMPGLKPNWLFGTDDAIYCMRTGDGGLPDSAMCRIDRSSFDWMVRVFPHESSSFVTNEGDPSSGIDPETGKAWIPPHWVIHEEPVDASFLAGDFEVEGERLVSTNGGQVTHVDPVTLELLDSTQ